MNTPSQYPAVSLVATPTKRHAIIDLAVEIERRGFAGIACPSLGATMSLCTSLAHATSSISFWTSIQPIYYNHPFELGNTAAHIHEISGGRFALGLGVSHEPVTKRLGVTVARPLADIEQYVAQMRANERFSGQLPSILLATLRDKMLALATRIAQGAIWANASLSAIPRQVSSVIAAKPDGFRLANMIPTVIDDDVAAARAVNRKTLTGYVILPNYRNYWRAAGYVEEMDAIESVIDSTPKESLAEKLIATMSDGWLDDCTISGPASHVRDRLATWSEAGVQPIAVMSSTSGGQAKAIGELFAAYQ
ncbi:MAG: LLM class flavin-dependent oxidoreductase [Ilumatobacteraceae bacterium]|jgi:alkanesulfonate monooxygenase SsuD/methylene tetrahydromethanopterin reductase-like flavin-dependent oxidoreductase (luciferase family)